jgi:fructoselysine-6-P-deglycase FrlB-like protein
MHGEETRRAIAAQPEWLARVPTDRRFPDGARLLFTGCGTSFHAAMTGGEAVGALELVLRPDREADLLVLVSHEGETPLTLEAARAWQGPRWLVTGKADGPIAELCEEVVVCTPAIEESWCHTASYTSAVAAIAALHGEDISGLPAAVAEALTAPLPEVGPQERFLVAGTGRDLATAHEAVLKLREGAWVAAEPYET